MQIARVDIINFRKLKNVSIDFSEDTTILVGANNSGKTSAVEALKRFCLSEKLDLTDVTLSNLPAINALGVEWEKQSSSLESFDEFASKQSADLLTPLLPQLDLWIRSNVDELYIAKELVPLLSDYQGGVGVKMRWEPEINALVNDFLKARAQVKNSNVAAAALPPKHLVDFLSMSSKSYFKLRQYRLNPEKLAFELGFRTDRVNSRTPVFDATSEALEHDVVGRLVRVNVIEAHRGLSNDTSAKSASQLISKYYEKHLNPWVMPSAEDAKALAALREASAVFDSQLERSFEEPLNEVAKLGYPGAANPVPLISTKLDLSASLNHDSALRYVIGSPTTDEERELYMLPEGSNGLGYQNLVLMIFRLLSFRDEWLRVGKASSGLTAKHVEPIHLVLVEEPEAHLHIQVQQVFINHAHKTLNNYDRSSSQRSSSVQLVVSTHSSHITHEVDFSRLRYFKRVNDGPVQTSIVKNLGDVFGNDSETKSFVSRYLKATHHNLFFADAAILFEGAAERVLLPSAISNEFPKIAQSFVEYLEVGGAHAHRLQPLIEQLNIPTIVITDLDGRNAENKRSRPQKGCSMTSGSTVIKHWLKPPTSPNNDIDTLVELPLADRVRKVVGQTSVYFAFQREIKARVTLPCDSGTEPRTLLLSAIPNTFEDALAFTNLEFLWSNKGSGTTGLLRKFISALERHVSIGNLDGLPEDFHKAITASSSGKSNFALDILLALDSEVAPILPDYISEGLSWLETTLATTNHLPSALDAKKEPTVSEATVAVESAS